MKKTIIALAAALATAFGAHAAVAHSVWVNLTDGSKIEYRFDDEPVASIEGEEVKMTLNMTGASVSYPIAQIVNFTFSTTELGLAEVGTAASPWFAVGRDYLEGGNLGASARVAVYTLEGQLLLEGACDSEGHIALPVGNLEKGVYLVSAGKHSFKFTR